MSRVWALFKGHPYVSNVVGYTTLFTFADLIQQSMLGGKSKQGPKMASDGSEGYPSVNRPEETLDPTLKSLGDSAQLREGELPSSSGTRNVSASAGIDWSQTARVAVVGFCFHANFNYHWLRGLERVFPGGGAKKVSGKVILDQLIAAPATISAFFIGLSVLEQKEDPLEDWRQKFWTSYMTGVVYWSVMQTVNFSLVPPVARTVFAGGISLVWTVFLCHFRQQ